MSILTELGINVVIALAVAVTPVVVRLVRTFRARRFWRPFSDADRVRVVVGKNEDLPDWERSGLVGAGDVEALGELQKVWFENHLGHLKTVFTKGQDGDVISENLILLGGPDANWATLLVAESVGGSLKFGDPTRNVITITDAGAGKTYSPGERNGQQIDYGVLKLTSNPYSPERSLLIVAGAFGHGTWGGIKLMRTKSFLTHPIVTSGQHFECLFRVEVVGDKPVNPEIEEIYPLPPSPRI